MGTGSGILGFGLRARVLCPDLAAGGPDALVEGHAEPWPVLGSSDLIPVQLDLSEWGGRPLLF
jgi:hypothetical protein